ncbi:unnamed protein product [Lactuca saligna]|uniref:Arabidopsis retrotransposon Orf1 C-terminal domain-containing protein n=1 Tax=Lactuca saligna TaxID=75948 RepID=A0AA35YEP5_LACSI|nr:unnamed protein product [Lactuca saligna]
MEGESSKRPRQTKSSARCRRSPSPPPRSPSPPPSSPPNPAHCGVVCHGPIQAAKLEAFLQRMHTTQQFAHVPSLRELHIYNQVHTLFRNIGWHGLLKVHELNYKVPTTEFLSSFDLDHGVLSFRLMNQDHAISLDQINVIVGPPKENIFGPNDRIPGYNDLTWWTDLTRQLPYVSSSAKASSLIHPVMKVAHRIVASLVIPKEERSTISTLELKILYAMAHPDDNLFPYYGSFLCTNSPASAHHGLAKYLMLALSVYWQKEEDGNHNWTVGQNHDPRLLITPENKDILALRRPNNFTDWQITPYLFPDSLSEEEDGDDDDEAEEEPHHASPTGGASSSHYAAPPSYHQQYMDEFQLIHTRLNTYQQDITSLTQIFSSFTTQYARNQEHQCKHEEDFSAWTRNSDYYPYLPSPPQ